MIGRHIDTRMDRRSAVKWMLVAFGSLHGAPGALAGGSVAERTNPATVAPAAAIESAATLQGYGKDPDLLRSYVPGELWPLTFTRTQRAGARWLAEQILPAAGSAPGAGTLGVHDFIDEWVSAPYDPCRADRAVVLEGLDWLDTASRARHGHPVEELPADSGRAVMELLADSRRAALDGAPAGFFGRYRKLVAIGYFTTPPGMQDLGYVGNRPTDSFEGPPDAALRKAGVKV
ncbi:MAG: gluconate 2-dehydrogenase subunit 3 family protein [Pseudomonadales bacterium]|nr:gluconate 2-dehydrogenase subunit 3 family protein [Pseudomonadales bacterium]